MFDTPPWTGPTASAVLEVVARVADELHPGRPPSAPGLDSVLDRDLGIDSLGRVELIQRIETAFDVSLPESVLAGAETPRDLLRAVALLAGAGGAGSTAKEEAIEPTVSVGLAVDGATAAPRSLATLTEVLAWHAGHHPDRVHVRFHQDEGSGPSLTYRELYDGALAVAAGLRLRGLAAGEAVVVMLPTGPEYFFSFMGVLLAGGIAVPIYPPARPSHLEEHVRRHTGIVGNCLAALVITSPEAVAVARLLRAGVESLREVVTVADLMGEGRELPSRLPTLESEGTAFLQYTSGSTGSPKGVTLSHANLLANIHAMGQALAVSPADVFVSWLPLYHDMGLIGAWLGPLYHAVPLVIMSPLAFLARPARWLRAIHRHGGTLSAGPNFAYELCRRRIDDRDLEGLDLGSWRAALNGAEPVAAEVVRGFCRRFAPHGFRAHAMMPVYGLAECSVGLAFPPLGREASVDVIERDALSLTGRAVPASVEAPRAQGVVGCGQPLPGHEIRIVDGHDRELPERLVGHIQFRGPSVTSGYFRNPAATAALFHGPWADSGDVGYMAGGDLHITGRVKDMIIRGGRNLYPAELEDAVGSLDGILRGNVAVFGSPDPRTGSERVIVLAETRKRAGGDLEALRHAIDGLAVDLLGGPVDEVVLAPPNTVLKTSSGKIRRNACREVWEKGLVGARRRAVWWQVTRSALAALGPEARRTARGAGALLWASWAWAVMGALAVPLWLGAVVPPGPAARWGVVGWLLRLAARLTGVRVTTRGLENLPGHGQPCVLVANHASYLDAFLLAAVLPEAVGFVGKAELRALPVVRLPLERLGTRFVERFDIQRGVADARALVEHIRNGQRLLAFPEGTFTRAPGLQPFHMGAFVAAAEAEVAVVPVAVRGTRSMLRAGSWFPRRGALTVTVDAPLTPEREGSSWSAAVILRDAARRRILRHCGEPDLAFGPTPM